MIVLSNTAAGKVVTGVESRTQALRKALSQIHKEGITGFYDRAGRRWSPEAYVNMDVRTAMLDAAGDKEGFEAEALKTRNAQAKYNRFCKETGRTKRLDRTQVYEYNRSVSSKATAAAKRERLKQDMLSTGALPQKAKIHITPAKINAQSLSFDDQHINKEQNHNVTEAEAKKWITNALFSVSVWNGDYERYYSRDGAVYVDVKNQRIRTAYSSSQYDDTTRKLLEVFMDANAR